MTIISDEFINRLIARPEIVREFPCLHLTSAPAGPVCCGRSADRAVDYNGIKASLAGMPDDRKAAFKTLLGVPGCRLIFRLGEQVADISF